MSDLSLLSSDHPISAKGATGLIDQIAFAPGEYLIRPADGHARRNVESVGTLEDLRLHRAGALQLDPARRRLPQSLRHVEIESLADRRRAEGRFSAPEVAAAAEDVPQPSPDQLRLSLKFSGECWTEISDADGRRLFYNMGRDGQTVELSGKAPVSALFGNADNVEVLVNNSAYSLPAPDSSNRTVRVAILNQ